MQDFSLIKQKLWESDMPLSWRENKTIERQQWYWLFRMACYVYMLIRLSFIYESFSTTLSCSVRKKKSIFLSIIYCLILSKESFFYTQLSTAKKASLYTTPWINRKKLFDCVFSVQIIIWQSNEPNHLNH